MHAARQVHDMDQDMFNGQYTGLTEIGRGASSTVYRAFSPAFARDVAIKMFHGSVDDADLRRRFQRECRVVGSLGDHPHVVSVFDSGFTRDRRPYLVMAHCSGGSFGQRLTGQGPRPPDEVAAVGIAVADALEAAHARGVVHRDVKPHNVLLTGYGVVALADFGVAVRGPMELTSLAATPGYAAPEVIIDHTNAGPAADVFAVGATLYALLTGGAPLRPEAGESELEFLLRAVEQPFSPLPASVPPPLAQVVHHCLAKDPDERPATATELRHLLRTAAQASGLVVPERLELLPIPASFGPAGPPMPRAPQEGDSRHEPAAAAASGARRPRSRRVVLAGAAAALTVAGAGGAIWMKPWAPGDSGAGWAAPSGIFPGEEDAGGRRDIPTDDPSSPEDESVVGARDGSSSGAASGDEASRVPGVADILAPGSTAADRQAVSNSGSGTESGTGTGSDTGTGSGDTGSDTGTGTDTDTGSDAGSEGEGEGDSGSGTGSDPTPAPGEEESEEEEPAAAPLASDCAGIADKDARKACQDAAKEARKEDKKPKKPKDG